MKIKCKDKSFPTEDVNRFLLSKKNLVENGEDKISGTLTAFARKGDGLVALTAQHVLTTPEGEYAGDQYIFSEASHETILLSKCHFGIHGKRNVQFATGEKSVYIDIAEMPLSFNLLKKHNVTLEDPLSIAKVVEGSRVSKKGAVTGVRYGKVFDSFFYLHPIKRKGAVFVVEPDPGKTFSESGDSGSLILDEYGKAIGILHGLVEVSGKILSACVWIDCCLEALQTKFQCDYQLYRRAKIETAEESSWLSQEDLLT